MALTRRHFLLGLSVGTGAILLAACGGTPTITPPPASTAPGSVPTVASTGTATGSAAASASRTASQVTGGTTAVSGPVKQVRVGYVPVLVYSPIFIAMEKGYFREQGIETVATPFTGGSDILAQTSSGNLEVGLSGLGASALNAFQRGLDLRIVSSQHTESPPLATPLVVARKKYDDGTFKKVADLKGKKVAINAKGTGTEYWLQAALAKSGLTMKDVDLTALAFDQVAAALNGGSLAGAMLGEPLVTLAEAQGLVYRLADDFLTNAQGTVIFYNLKWGRDNAALADRWLAAWLRGARDLDNGGYAKDENAAIIEKFTKTPAATVKAAKPPRHEPNGTLNLADMRAQQEYFLTSGSLTYNTALDLNNLIDTGFADRAVAIIGKK
ncbi:MAG TPA: ABC transporter substrate-binding protein [Thermomicrobiales bacterium]